MVCGFLAGDLGFDLQRDAGEHGDFAGEDEFEAEDFGFDGIEREERGLPVQDGVQIGEGFPAGDVDRRGCAGWIVRVSRRRGSSC